MKTIFRDTHPFLGVIPGPLHLATRGNVTWAVGGGRGESNVLRFDGTRWSAIACQTNGLRAVLPLSDTEALVCGEYGFLAFVDAEPSAVRQLPKTTQSCLFTLAERDGSWVAAGDDGKWFDVSRTIATPRALGFLARMHHLTAFGSGFLAACSDGLRLIEGTTTKLLFTTDSPLTSSVIDDTGIVFVSGDDGQLWRWEPGQPAERVELGLSVDIERACLSGGVLFLGLGDGRVLEVNPRTRAVTQTHALDHSRKITGLAPMRDGLLVGAWEQIGPPYAFRGTLAFLGDRPPLEVNEPRRQSLPPPRERTVALDVDTFLDETECRIVTVDEAKAALPHLTWPDTSLTRVRLYEGNVRVKDTTQLLGNTERRGYAVAVTGHLVVEGVLDAVAGGDGYDSVLLVGKDVWAEAAVFRYGIKATIAGTFEVRRVILCSHGDDGGTLEALALRAQVFAYSCYFPRPECELDGFWIGDVYGDETFPPARANEVFVPEVLESGGFDESGLAEALRAGAPVLVTDAPR